MLLACAVAVAAGVVVGAAVHFGGGTSSPDVTLAATSSTSALSTSSVPSPPALPRSAPLAPTELIVPMRVRGNWDLYLADTRRTAPVRQLTEDPAAEYGEALSPDRATMIFMRDPDPSDQSRTLWVAGAAHGEDARPLFDPVPPECSAMMYRPAWNPVDTSMLALPCTNRQGHWGLYLIRTNGTMVREIPVPGDAVDDPAFSPDGKQLVFWAGSRSGLDGGDLYVQAVDSDQARRRLTHSAIAGRDADPTWDSDGKSVVFRRRIVDGTSGGNNDIYRLAVDGSGKATALAHSPADAQDPSLSPDGTEIAYTANGAAKEWPGKPVQRVWIRDSNGQNPRLLWTKGAASEQAAPAWSRR